MNEGEYNATLEVNKAQLEALVMAGELARAHRDRGNNQLAREIGRDIIDVIQSLDEVTVQRLLVMSVLY